ncbi:MAG TPA: hypothetical protein VJ869_01890 [Sphaerochaeta sp.]|nr:hypothetical protein [Sphaerochaeta sp.]
MPACFPSLQSATAHSGIHLIAHSVFLAVGIEADSYRARALNPAAGKRGRPATHRKHKALITRWQGRKEQTII